MVRIKVGPKVKVRSKPFKSQLVLGRSRCVAINSRAHYDHNTTFAGSLSQFDRMLLTKMLITQIDPRVVICDVTESKK